MMNQMERHALEMLLVGEDPLLEVLRAQLAEAAVIERRFSGVGFFTDLSVPEVIPRAENCPRKVIGDVYAEVEELRYDAGFLLFVTDGAVDCLECFTVDDQWPETATLRRLYYVHPTAPGSGTLVETTERDLEWVLRDAV